MSRNPKLNRALSEAWESLERQASLPPEPRIAQRVAAHLPPDLAAAVLERERIGRGKYGQYLDENHQPQKGRAVHLVQELLDAQAYLEWLGSSLRYDLVAHALAWLTVRFCRRYGLSAEDIIEGGKQ